MATPQRAAQAVMDPRTTPAVDFVSAEERSAPEGRLSPAVSLRGGRGVGLVGCEPLVDVTVGVAVGVGHDKVGVDWPVWLVVFVLGLSSRA